MNADFRAMLWKEWRERPRVRGRDGAQTTVGGILLVLIFGALYPSAMDPSNYVRSPLVIFFSCLPGLLLITNAIPDAFAGERERKTLDALLATPLDDRAIVFAKLAAAALPACGASLAILPVSLLTVNMRSADAGFLLFAGHVVWGSVACSVLLVLLVGASGILISYRSTSVRHAQQVLAATVLFLMATPLVAYQLLGDRLSGVTGDLLLVPPASLLARCIVVLAATDAVLLAVVARTSYRNVR